MKRISALITSAYLFSSAMAQSVFAATETKIQVVAPSSGVSGAPGNIGVIIGAVLRLAYGAALLLVLVFLILGAFNWITSGGDKEKVKNARGLIVNALIGLAILAFAVLITNVFARVLNLGDVFNFTIPGLPAPGEAPPAGT